MYPRRSTRLPLNQTNAGHSTHHYANPNRPINITRLTWGKKKHSASTTYTLPHTSSFDLPFTFIKKKSVINGYGFHGAPHVNAWVMSRALLWSFGRELYFQLFGNHYHFDYEEIKKGIKILLTRDLGLFRAALTHWLLKRQLWAALRSGNRQTES